MAEDTSPDSFDAVLNWIPGAGHYLDSFYGLAKVHSNYNALGVGAVDEMMGDGLIGSAEGAAETKILTSEGVPTWLADLGGVATGYFGKSSPIMTALVAGVADLGVFVAKKLFGFGSPQPSLDATHAPG